MKSNDGGFSWQEVSPDLTQKAETEKEKKKPDPRRAVINTIALSTVKAGVIWAGTGNGLIQVTKDGKTWQNVTIPGLHERSSVTLVEASRHDAAAAYAVVNGFRDLRPLIYRTRDYGQSWQLINTGLPETGNARVVREDPARKGLLYAGTWNGIYFSLDDGDHWQTLQLNLPTATVTDLDVHGDDLVASTYGRSLWILDDITPLRQLDAKWPQSDAYLLRPRNTVRVRWDMNQDTPLPPETPAGSNPPDGATIYYFLKSAPAGDIKLSIYDAQNHLVREYTDVAPTFDKTPGQRSRVLVRAADRAFQKRRAQPLHLGSSLSRDEGDALQLLRQYCSTTSSTRWPITPSPMNFPASCCKVRSSCRASIRWS